MSQPLKPDYYLFSARNYSINLWLELDGAEDKSLKKVKLVAI